MEQHSTAQTAQRAARARPARGGSHHTALAVAALAAFALVGGLVACEAGGRHANIARPIPSAAPTTTSPGRTTAPRATAAPPSTVPAAGSASNPSSAAATPPSSGGASASRGLPTSAEGYATAAFDAWLQGNDPRLRKLATEPVADFLAARTPHEPGEWSGPACDGAAGSTYCAWTQPDAELVIRVGNEAVSQRRKHAVVEAFFTVPAGGVAVWPFTTPEQAANAQTAVDEGHQPWLLDAATVAVSYAGAELGWQDATVEQEQTDPGIYRVTDPASGARADITLAQPVRQGQGGIWAIVRAGSPPA